jgi:hypothetical protein
MNDTKMRDLLTGTAELSKASLATRMLVSRLRIEVRAQPASLSAKMDELKAFIAKNAFAVTDLATV